MESGKINLFLVREVYEQKKWTTVFNFGKSHLMEVAVYNVLTRKYDHCYRGHITIKVD